MQLARVAYAIYQSQARWVAVCELVDESAESASVVARRRGQWLEDVANYLLPLTKSTWQTLDCIDRPLTWYPGRDACGLLDITPSRRRGDHREWASRTDGVVLVLHEGQTAQSILDLKHEFLGIPILGAILLAHSPSAFE